MMATTDETVAGERVSTAAPADLGNMAVASTMAERHRPNEERLFWHLIAVFSASVGMIGVCLTAIGIVQLLQHLGSYETICDQLLVADAVLFLASAHVSFLAIRRRIRHKPILLQGVVDVMFFSGLVVMVLICGLFAWAIT